MWKVSTELPCTHNTLPCPIGQPRSILMQYPGYLYYVSANYMCHHNALKVSWLSHQR
jgi:hypothetical protein